MIKTGDSVFDTSGSRPTCRICSRSFNPMNGMDKAMHARRHVISGQAEEKVYTVPHESRQRYEYWLTEKGAAAANARAMKAVVA